MAKRQYKSFKVVEVSEEEALEHKLVDYFPLTRVFVDTFFQTVAFILVLWAILNLIMLTSNIFTWVESFSSVGSVIINSVVQAYNQGEDRNLGAVEAICFVGGLGSCTGANTIPDFYVPFNPQY